MRPRAKRPQLKRDPLGSNLRGGMNMILRRPLALSLVCAVGIPLQLAAQSGAPPQDRPFATDSAATVCLNLAIQSRVDHAHRTFPAARERFQEGLPAGHRFYVTMRLRDTVGRMEQVFMAVDSLTDARLYGSVASQIGLIQGYQYGQRITVPTDSILDWLISRPDGTEEGNFVGNYLDTLQVELRRRGGIPNPC